MNEQITVNLSWQSVHLLKELERWGIYGATKEEVAARFIDKGLIDLAEKKMLKLVREEPKATFSNPK